MIRASSNFVNFAAPPSLGTTTPNAASFTTMRTSPFTVSTLPAGAQGMTSIVTDALAPSFLVAVVGGGSVITPVFHNGTAWVVG